MEYHVIKQNGVYWIQDVRTGVIDYMAYRTKKLATARAKLFMREGLPLFDRRK